MMPNLQQGLIMGGKKSRTDLYLQQRDGVSPYNNLLVFAPVWAKSLDVEIVSGGADSTTFYSSGNYQDYLTSGGGGGWALGKNINFGEAQYRIWMPPSLSGGDIIGLRDTNNTNWWLGVRNANGTTAGQLGPYASIPLYNNGGNGTSVAWNGVKPVTGGGAGGPLSAGGAGGLVAPGTTAGGASGGGDSGEGGGATISTLNGKQYGGGGGAPGDVSAYGTGATGYLKMIWKE